MAPRMVCACALGLVVSATLAQAGSEPTIRAGKAATFVPNWRAGRWRPIPVRSARIGPPDTRPGEITLGLTPPGSIGIVKVHLFERTQRVFDVDVVAMAGERRLAHAVVCGHRDLDSWTVLPLATTRVMLHRISPSKGGCD